MNKKSWIVAIPVLLMLFLQGCKQIDADIEGKIAAPKVNTISINGSYNIESFKAAKDNENENRDLKKYIGKKAFFFGEMAILGDEICKSPQYKVKSVSAGDFFLNKYKTSSNSLGISTDKIEVVSVTSNDQLFYDFIKIDDNTLLVPIDAGFLYLKKYSNNVDPNVINLEGLKDDQNHNNSSKVQDNLVRSGVLIGLRTEEDNGAANYRTLWIAAKNKELKPVLQTPQLFVPRGTGFWEVGLQQKKEGTKNMNSIYAKPVISLTKSEPAIKQNELSYTVGKRTIIFVGNDYIGTQYENKEKKADFLQVLPIDNIKSGKGIIISDVIKGNAKELLARSSEAYLSSLDKDKVERLEKLPRMDNFTLGRRNGHWFMKGRLNYAKPINDVLYEEFSINITPPDKLITYDELCIPWNQIKTRLPETIDAYTSPNRDIAILCTKNYIYIYSIQNGNLADKPLRRLKIKEGENVVMAEWATGEYTEKWNEIVKNRAVEFKDE